MRLETTVFKETPTGEWMQVTADQIKPGDKIISIGIDGQKLWAVNLIQTKAWEGEVFHKDQARGDGVFVANALNVLGNANALMSGPVTVGGFVVSDHSMPATNEAEAEVALKARGEAIFVSAASTPKVTPMPTPKPVPVLSIGGKPAG